MGEEDPLRAWRWINDLERTFEICECTESQKMLYASYRLQGEAAARWETKQDILEMEVGSFAAVTWRHFMQEFDDHFFPNIVKRQKAR